MALLESEALAVVAVQRLLARAAHLTDAADGDAYAKLFTEDAVIEGHPRGPFHGREAIARYYNERQAGTPPHRHHITSIDVHMDEDGVLRSTNYVTVVGGDLIAGVEEHEFERHGEEWVIKRKLTRLEFRPNR
jgi:uncharacterized protein (TIGR02246 family)